MAKDIDWVGPRSLRKACIVSFLASIGLAIPPSVVLRQALPALGLLPLFGSAAFSAVLLRKGGTQPSPLGIFVADMLLTTSLVIVYVLTWVIWANMGAWDYYHNTSALKMLAGYATMTILVNMCIHWFLAARALYLRIRRKATPNRCPHCAHHIPPRASSLPWFLEDESARLLADDGDEETRYRDDEEHAGKEPVVGITGQTAAEAEPSGNGRATLSLD